MILKNKEILIISPEKWDHLLISKHHYAIHLANRGNRVFFLNPPGGKYLVQETKYVNLKEVDYPGFIPGLRFLPSRLQRYFIQKIFLKIEKLCDAKFDIVWSFDNSVFYDFKSLPERVLSISHIVDWSQDFQFEKAASTADICFSVTSFILEKQRKFNANSFFINHGFTYKNTSLESKRLPGKNNIKAAYMGNLAISYIDWVLLKKIILENPKVDFCFAGIKNHEFDNISHFNNVYYVGVLGVDETTTFCESSDILILTYLYADFPIQLSNPHKMMSYFGAGKVIVATWTHEYVTLRDENLLLMSKTMLGFEENFKSAADDLWYWNSIQLMERRKQFARENTYDKQINRIEKLLERYV